MMTTIRFNGTLKKFIIVDLAAKRKLYYWTSFIRQNIASESTSHHNSTLISSITSAKQNKYLLGIFCNTKYL